MSCQVPFIRMFFRPENGPWQEEWSEETIRWAMNLVCTCQLRFEPADVY
jgi:hypothetical protein